MAPPATNPPKKGGILGSLLFLAIPILVALFLTRSPYMMAAVAPSPARPWADAPIKLVTTPQYETKKTDIFTTGATHMALVHNAILRGYNSIYQQAPHVQDADKADFVGYCQTWHKFVVSHHDDEEETLFTAVAKVLDDQTVWEGTLKEHEAFLGGLAAFHKYLAELASPQAFSGAELQRIMTDFQDAFEAHFHSEISTIAALADHPKAPKSGTPQEADTRALFKSWGKNTVTKAGTLDVVPFFLLNLDGTVEDGMWANWPPIPAPIKWGLTNLAGAYHGGWWKFSSCAGGRPKALYALKSE